MFRNSTAGMKAVFIAVLLLTLAAAPVAAAPSGDVTATVQVDGPCITVPSAPIVFGSVGFSTESANSEKPALSQTISPCTAQTMDLYAKASNAAGDGTGAWTIAFDGTGLVCTLGADQFGAGVRGMLDVNPTWLSTTDTLVNTGTGYQFYPHLMMPCSNSSGVGETMTYTYTFTAVLP
jgi:hypothetical protein